MLGERPADRGWPATRLFQPEALTSKMKSAEPASRTQSSLNFAACLPPASEDQVGGTAHSIPVEKVMEGEGIIGN
eukprot:CAMPEP_0175121146 /NCGR_PEP_ID=MMETSP0087-20121206/1008_1 /TAXON_ID=136419 /ORGANISM="Unknown Unknown, Strain D1" /LENGTH=74 /DNA_ID=CAMNT_0016402659 /DNA_START=336 /DNA_END=560 /DNA_ORIENTATION=-